MADLLLPLGCFLLLLAAGYLYAGASSTGRPLYLTLALSHLLGAAALAAGVTVGLVLTNEVHAAAGLSGLAVLAGAGLWLRTRPSRTSTPLPSHTPPGWRELALLLLVLVGVGTAAARLVLLPLDWDGWAIWQFKAKAMVDGSLYRFLTAPEFWYAHPDYPLLVPSATWWLSPSTFSPKLAQVSGFLFFLDLLAVFYASATARTGRLLALVGCATLVSWPLVMKHSVSGFADLTLAVYVLAATVFLAEDRLRLALPLLIGAILTKNEGLFTLVGAVAAYAGCQRWARPAELVHSPAARKWGRIAAVAVTGVITLGCWSIMKRRWDLAADLLDTERWPSNLAAAVLERVPLVASGFAREALSFGPHYPGWGFFWPFALVGLALSAVKRRYETLPFWLMAGAHLAGAALAYLITPLDPANHISRSLDRLLFQFAPTALLAALMAFTPVTAHSHERHEVADEHK